MNLRLLYMNYLKYSTQIIYYIQKTTNRPILMVAFRYFFVFSFRFQNILAYIIFYFMHYLQILHGICLLYTSTIKDPETSVL